MPEAQKLLKKEQAGGAPDTTTPGATSTTPAAAAEPPGLQGPKPMPLPPIGNGQTVSKKTTVTIDADEAAFDSKSAIIIYTGHVRARHPQFYIECEELEVHMVKDDPKAAKKPAPPKDPILSKDSGKKQDSGIKMAIARGPMVIIEKLAENGDIQIGKCKKAVYRSATGQIVMSDLPQVQRGNMLHIADQPDTEMTFDPNGKLHTSGHTRTVILQGEEGASSTPRGNLLPTGNGNPNAQ
jgi:lipopolysaccharide export system protein LptA